ncbi:MAG: hypothetical protein PHI97_03730 [Desulfobulbus sp.]|nr:hypothetical protein [Desulfobulbus sp.]
MKKNESRVHKKLIPQMKLEVCSRCQNDCEMCAHGEMRKFFPNYELTLEQLKEFLLVTESSGYFINNIRMHGPGEPLFWKFLNEGLQLLRNSSCIGTVFVATNGLLLNLISEKSWGCIDEMRVSIYDNTINNEMISGFASKYPDIIKIEKQSEFRKLPASGDFGEIPCKCICNGPMLFGDKILLYCGPPVFGTTAYRNNREDCLSSISTPVATGWYDKYQANKEGNLNFCYDCWANSNLKLDRVNHLATHGGWSKKSTI